MRFKTIHKRYSILLLTFYGLLSAFCSCKKTDSFYTKLSSLPQVNVSSQYAYKPSYVVGDTMVITGKLQPQNNLQITIGGIAATVVKIGSVVYYPTQGSNDSSHMDQVSLIITAGMAGKAREVKITTGGYSGVGPTIDIFTYGGPGSFNDSLKAVQVASLDNPANNFLYCVNGKGDVYYYAPDTRDIRHIRKDGTQEISFDLSGLPITNFLAGGVDPNGNYLYFSVQTASGYLLDKVDLQTKTVTTLNQSTGIAAPYEGNISTVKMIVTAIYPDSKGNVYFGIGLGPQNGDAFVPDAIAQYSAAQGTVTYIYKQLTNLSQKYAGMPGIILTEGYPVIDFRFSPDENLLYLLESGATDFRSNIGVYDLAGRAKLQQFPGAVLGTGTTHDVIGSFSGLNFDLGYASAGAIQPDIAFGFLPMPGRRLQTLLYQFYNSAGQTMQYGFPKWVVFDFTDQRTYAYALGSFNRSSYIFQPTGNLFPRSHNIDQLLNYDESGNLYMTASGKTALIKTQTAN